jgi:hypothetical protein
MDRATIYDKTTGVETDVVPEDLHDVMLLVLGQDQGPQCTAGHAYMNATEEYLVLGKWGRIHRLCNDLKQSLNAQLGMPT